MIDHCLSFFLSFVLFFFLFFFLSSLHQVKLQIDFDFIFLYHIYCDYYRFHRAAVSLPLLFARFTQFTKCFVRFIPFILVSSYFHYALIYLENASLIVARSSNSTDYLTVVPKPCNEKVIDTIIFIYEFDSHSTCTLYTE